MIDWFDTIKRYYDMGIYKSESSDPLYVGLFVQYEKITPEQYQQITGLDYITE